MPSPHKYTRSQLEQYYERITLPEAARKYDVSSLTPEQQLAYLTLLETHQLVKVPFENLLLHYSWHRAIHIDAEHLFDKIVCQPGRGGYCMENNSFFHVILASIGFHVYMVPSRVADPDGAGYTGLTHCLNIVTIAGERYAVDVGFGANGPCHPCKLESELVQDHILPAKVRFRYGVFPGCVGPAGSVWFYEHQIDDDAEWVPKYCFVDTELQPNDLQAMNWAPWQSPTSVFRKMIICVRFTAGESVEQSPGSGRIVAVSLTAGEDEVEGRIDGALIITDRSLKWRRNGEKLLETVFHKEEDRTEALAKYFGITLSPKDTNAIIGTGTEIRETQ